MKSRSKQSARRISPRYRADTYSVKHFSLERVILNGTPISIGPGFRGFIRAHMAEAWLAGHRAGKEESARLPQASARRTGKEAQ